VYISILFVAGALALYFATDVLARLFFMCIGVWISHL